MSIDKTVLDELRDQIILIDDSLANKIFIGHEEDEQPSLDEWIRLSLVTTVPTNLTINAQVKNVIVLVHYYIKSGEKADYDRPSQLKDLIQENLPIINRDYWFNCECLSETYDIDKPDEDQEYEGFILELNFNYLQQLTCKVADYLTTDDEYSLVTDAGGNITED